MQDEHQQYDSLSDMPAPRPDGGAGDSGNMPHVFWIIVGSSTVLAILIVLFLILRGYQAGQMQGDAQVRQQVAILLQQADDALATDNAEAALDAYRSILILDADNGRAVEGLNELLESVSSMPAGETPSPTPPTATSTPLNPLELVWADAQALYEAGRWEEAAGRLQQIQATDTEFEADRVEEMLFTSFTNLATEKGNEGSLEESVRLYDRALEIRPDAQDIRSIRDSTAHYMDALTYWYVDWPQVIELLTELYEQDASYRDVRQRLHQAHLEYADNLARQGQWCAAAEEYSNAVEVQNAPDLVEQQTEFETLCEQGATEIAEGTDTQDPSTAAEAEGGTTQGLGTGRILYAAQDPVDGRYRVFVQPVSANVRPVVLVEDAMQPALRADGQRLAFRSMRGDQRGLASFDPASGLRLRYTIYAEDSLPSWNPEGNRLVFASDREGDRRWRIYVAWADGNDNGNSLVFGQDPDWHPTEDSIVYKGCDERGNGCGLRTMNSDAGRQMALTTVPGDSHPVWSPDGQSVVFMSQERDSNWDLYRVNVETGNVVRLTDHSAIDGIPSISPDGSRVAFLSNRDGAWAIWVMPINGGAAQQLAPLSGDLPDWLVAKLHWVR